jgi:hypothetical protein
MSNKVIYPSINLFLYDLKEGLGQDETKISKNCEEFCQKIYGNLDKTKLPEKLTQFQKYQNSEADIIELLDTKTQKFESPLDGFYYPLQIGDTYALEVNYSGKLDVNGKPNDIVQNIDDKPFLKLKQEITQKLFQQTGTLGQTWLVWGKLTSNETADQIEKIAQDCYTQIVSNYKWERDFIAKGSLLGGTIFELWYQPQNLGSTGKEFWDKFRQESHHVVIWLFPDNQTPDEMRKQIVEVNEDFLRLFQYRHKIVWAYHQSRQQKSLLKREYIEIQPSIVKCKQLPRQLETNTLQLNQLQETLTTNLINLADYSTALNALGDQDRTIKVNLDNYQVRLGSMKKKYASSNLDCLKIFSENEIYAQKYQRQIAADYANLSPGLTLLQNLNSTIQGIIDLEQTKSDRTLNTTIALGGIGLATSQVASAVILIQEVPKSNPDDFLLSYRTQVFIQSIGIGAIATLISFLIFRRLRR